MLKIAIGPNRRKVAAALIGKMVFNATNKRGYSRAFTPIALAGFGRQNHVKRLRSVAVNCSKFPVKHGLCGLRTVKYGKYGNRKPLISQSLRQKGVASQ